MLCFSPHTFIFCNSELPEMEWYLAVSIALSYINEMNIRKMPVIIEEPSLFQSKAISILVVQNMLKKKDYLLQIQTVAKHRNIWVENADRLVAGFLEMFEEGCHKMVRSLCRFSHPSSLLCSPPFVFIQCSYSTSDHAYWNFNRGLS